MCGRCTLYWCDLLSVDMVNFLMLQVYYMDEHCCCISIYAYGRITKGMHKTYKYLREVRFYIIAENHQI